MSEQRPSPVWGAGNGADRSPEEPGTHRLALPSEPGAEEEATTSYGEMFDYPPYATEEAPMTVDVPSSQSPSPSPRPSGERAPTDPSAQSVTCPECGAVQQVHLNRREAVDFCRRCDFPLFWVPARVDRGWQPEASGESLRRLPGTAGANRLASAACPHCAELNLVTAEVCIRCGQAMRLAPPPPPPPAPVAPPPPPPEPVAEPERGIPWWVWLLVGIGVAAVITVVVLVVTGVIH